MGDGSTISFWRQILVLQIRAFVVRVRLLISRSSVFNCHIWTFVLCVFVFFPRWFASQPRSEATTRLFSYLFFFSLRAASIALLQHFTIRIRILQPTKVARKWGIKPATSTSPTERYALWTYSCYYPVFVLFAVSAAVSSFCWFVTHLWALFFLNLVFVHLRTRQRRTLDVGEGYRLRNRLSKIVCCAKIGPG